MQPPDFLTRVTGGSIVKLASIAAIAAGVSCLMLRLTRHSPRWIRDSDLLLPAFLGMHSLLRLCAVAAMLLGMYCFYKSWQLRSRAGMVISALSMLPGILFILVAILAVIIGLSMSGPAR